MSRYDKYCYQTMKKLYAMKYIDCDKFLMLDSETAQYKNRRIKI